VGRILVAAVATEGAFRTGCLGTADYRGKCSIASGLLDVGVGKPYSFFGKHRALSSAEVARSKSKLFLSVPNLVTIYPNSIKLRPLSASGVQPRQ